MSASPDSIVLLSGGMDSCVAAAVAASRGSFAALHVQYGQRTARREEAAFRAVADRLGALAAQVITVPELPRLGGTSLTDPSVPIDGPEMAPDGIPSSYVPFRNGLLLALGVGWAESLGAGAVYLGAVEEDSSGYPDCREEFIRAFQAAAEAGTRPGTRIRIETPVIHLDKSAIIRLGLELEAPLELTWSCYVREDRACGRCDSCRLRLAAFERAGVRDPIEYMG